MKSKIKNLALLLIVSLLMTISIGCESNEDKKIDNSKVKGEAKESYDLKDGDFIGEGLGNGGLIKLEVKINKGKIEDIEVLDEKETEILTEAAFTDLISGIIENQSTNIDTVTGATITSNAIIEAVKDALTKAGADDNFFDSGEKINIAKKEDKLEQNYDVVIIGGGGAGLSAAIEAKEKGADVVVLEKMSGIGGNTLVSGGGLNVPGTRQQKEEKVEDSVDLFIKDTLEGGSNISDKNLVRVMAENALETANWLESNVGVEFMEDRLQQFGGHSVPRALIPKNNNGVELIGKLSKKAIDLGVEIKTETKAEYLIKDGDKVIGVKASNKAGQNLTFNASKGVVIASGGFGANEEMRVKYDPDKDGKYKTTDVAGTTGDGIIMAEELGADLIHMEHIQTYPTCNPKTGIMSYVANSRFDGAILVNQEGERFVEEMDRRDVISEAILKQTDNIAYLVWGQEVEKVGNMTKVHENEYKMLEEMDLIYKADNLEDLAEYFNIDEANFLKTIEKFNKFVDDGEDKDFNHRNLNNKINEGPFYIEKVTPSIHHTMGGLVINENAEVLNSKGEVIKGLYAAGEVTGGIHGANRLGGNAVTDVLVFGRIAGKNAASN